MIRATLHVLAVAFIIAYMVNGVLTACNTDVSCGGGTSSTTTYNCTRLQSTQTHTLVVDGTSYEGQYCYFRCETGVCPATCYKVDSSEKTTTVSVTLTNGTCHSQSLKYKDADQCYCQ